MAADRSDLSALMSADGMFGDASTDDVDTYLREAVGTLSRQAAKSHPGGAECAG
jgi:hypothetical protein